MKVEIHSHTNVYSGCSQIPPRELIGMAEAAGYDALFLTDHNRVWSPRELAGIREWSTRIRVFPGIEVSLPSRVDLLILGTSNPIYETLTTPSDVFAQACTDGCLTVIAHPFRWCDELPDYCALADAIEVRSCNHPFEEQAEAAREYAEIRHLAEVYSSDAHGLNFLNRFWLETDEPFTTHEEFRRIILSGRYENRVSDAEAELPPLYKASTMDELTEQDRLALLAQPTL